MTIIPHDSSSPLRKEAAHPIVTAELVEIDGTPHIQLAFPTLQAGESPALPLDDAERFAFYLLNLVLDTKQPLDPLADRTRAHLGSPPLDREFAPEGR